MAEASSSTIACASKVEDKIHLITKNLKVIIYNYENALTEVLIV